MRHIHISLPINIFKTSAVRLLVEHLGILEQNQNKIAVFFKISSHHYVEQQHFEIDWQTF